MSNIKVIAFDIGIKNLAFCILQGSTVYCLENTNILAPVEHVKCVSCKASAKFVANSVHTCKRHVPKTFIVHTTNPTIPDLKILAKENGISLTKKTKGDLIAALSTKYAFPSGEYCIFFPKSTKCGEPIFMGYPFNPVSPNNGFCGVSGQSFQVRP